jgi:hypothetical protein
MIRTSVGVTVVTALAVVGALTVMTKSGEQFYAASATSTPATTTAETVAPPAPTVEHIETPTAVKAIYMTQCAASHSGLRNHLLQLAADTEINSIIVDVKDYSGTIAFDSGIAEEGGTGCTIPNFRSLVKDMHDRGIYVIARLTVFQDPLYAKAHPSQAVKKSDGVTVWKDGKGLSFIDVGSKQFHDYIIALSKEAHEVYGVDEINYDYIRYPSDGDMKDISFTLSPGDHAENLERFFRYLAEQMDYEVTTPAFAGKPEGMHRPVLSADLFGMVTTNTDDLGIGQVLERAFPYFDYIAPMVYPSHYPPGFNGYANPNNHSYDLIHYVMSTGAQRAVATTTTVAGFTHVPVEASAQTGERIGTSTPAIYKKPSYPATILRPWLQDFDYGGDYGPEEVRAQIQATYDAGLTSWMLWDPRNQYTRDALKSEE